MDEMRIIADLATIRRLAIDIRELDDEFSTNSADAEEIVNMCSSLIKLIEKEGE